MIAGIDLTNDELTLNRPNTDLFDSLAIGYTLELGATVLGDAQPVPFPRGVVIDLDGSQVPDSWRPVSFTGGAYAPQMDILFSPRGSIVGDALNKGLLHFHFADVGDVARWHALAGRNTNATANPTNFTHLPFVPVDDPINPTVITVTKDRVLATLATRTGNVSAHKVNIPNTTTPIPMTDYQNLAIDPFLFAETGQVATK